MLRNNNYTKENLLDYLYHLKYYKFIDTDLSRQANASIPQQIDFKGKLDENDGAIFDFYRNYFKLFFRFINCRRIT